MPCVRVTNLTPVSLNVSLKQLSALNFENDVKPGQTVKFNPGGLWYTVEALVDTKENRYSLAKSAAAIAVISVALGVTAVTAGAALLPNLGLLSTMALGAKSTLIAYGPDLAKMFPKAVAAVTGSVGGLTALQQEVISILSSPMTPSSLRARGLHILSGLRRAYAEDAARSDEQRKRDEQEAKLLEASAKKEEKKGKDKKDKKTGLVRSHGVVEDKGVGTGSLLRKHGVYLGEDKQLEIRIVGQNLAVYDPQSKSFL